MSRCLVFSWWVIALALALPMVARADAQDDADEIAANKFDPAT